MNAREKIDKAKPFKLYKYVTFTSFIVIFVGTIVLSALNTHWAREMQFSQSEDYALLLVSNLNHQIFRQFVLPMSLKYGKIQLSETEQFERLDTIVRGTVHGFNVKNVNVYDLNNIISYSFDSGIMGIENLGGPGYENARRGNITSSLEQNGSFIEIFLGIPKDIQLITFAPLHAETSLAAATGPMIGVVEIVQDIAEDYRTIFSFQVLVVLTTTLVMAVVFLALVLTVKRGEKILENRAKERLQLIEKLNRAEHLSSIGEMVAGVSHEIRNPLGIIRSSAELLKKKMPAAEAPSPLPDIIIEEGGRLNNIITDFLNYAKPKSPCKTDCNIIDVLEKIIQYLHSDPRMDGYRIEKYYAPGIPSIKGDQDMLHQAFLNLLLNAVQSMPNKGTLTISVELDGPWLRISFKDQGDGIPENLLEKIWDPFFTTKEKGTGLGLGIVKNIIEAHRGGIQIHNRMIKGAAVTIRLPLA